MLVVVNLFLAVEFLRGPCPDLWLPAGLIREWIGSFSIAPFTALRCLQPISERPHCCYMIIDIAHPMNCYNMQTI